MTGSGALDRILAAVAPAPGRPDPLVVGWATVDLDRATAELATELGIATAAFLSAPDSVVLGARSRVAFGVLPGGMPLAILEPRTEGRLAAALARQGEGPWVTWARSAVKIGRGPSRSRRPGPFGPEHMYPGTPTDGPFLLLIGDGPGTILA